MSETCISASDNEKDILGADQLIWVMLIVRFGCADKFSHLRDQLSEFPGFALTLKEREVRPQNLRNPFDIPRSALLDQVARMRANFLQPSLAHTKLHDDGKNTFSVSFFFQPIPSPPYCFFSQITYTVCPSVKWVTTRNIWNG